LYTLAFNAPAFTGQALHRAETTTGGFHRRQLVLNQSSQGGFSV
jgi:hypothetical protein